MKKNDFRELTDEQLLVEKEKLNKSKIFHATMIGFLAGVLIFGLAGWLMSTEKHIGFLIPMLIPIVFIYRMLKGPNKNKNLEEVLKERNLD
jgi:hypothetical protein